MTFSHSRPRACFNKVSSSEGSHTTQETGNPQPNNSALHAESTSNLTHPTPPQAPSHLLPAPFRDGTEPQTRPAIKDYTDDVKNVLEDTILNFKCLLYTENAFPSVLEARKQAQKAWDNVCDTRKVPVPWQLSDRMIRAVRVTLFLFSCLTHCPSFDA